MTKSAKKPRKEPTGADRADEQSAQANAEKPVSLHPLGFKEAVRGLLQTGREKGKTGGSEG